MSENKKNPQDVRNLGEVESVIVTDNEDNVIAVVDSHHIIEHEGYKVIIDKKFKEEMKMNENKKQTELRELINVELPGVIARIAALSTENGVDEEQGESVEKKRESIIIFDAVKEHVGRDFYSTEAMDVAYSILNIFHENRIMVCDATEILDFCKEALQFSTVNQFE